MLRKGGLLAAGLAVVWMTGAAMAAELKVAQHISGAEKFNPEAETIRFFEGIDDGQLTVHMVAEGASRCRFQITNRTEEPLNVVMPGAFAAVPVLTIVQEEDDQPILIEEEPGDELPPPEGDDLPPPEGEDVPPPEGEEVPPEDPQKLGIGCPYADGSEINTFSFVPNRTVHLQLRSVCLEHNRPGPNPKHNYQVRPMDQVTNVKGVYEICAMMGRGEIDHQIAQIAAWHLNNKISWDQLWNESQNNVPGMGQRRGMSRRQLFDAKKAVEKAVGQSWTKMTSLLRSAADSV